MAVVGLALGLFDILVLLCRKLVAPEGPKNPLGRFVPFPNVVPFAGADPLSEEGDVKFKFERRANPTAGGEAL